MIQGILNIFHILYFLAGGGRPPPLLAELSAKKSIFFWRPPLQPWAKE